MAGINKISLLSKFQGALVGAVLGDCIGAHFEGAYWYEPVPLQKLLQFVQDKIETRKSNVPDMFTDDTAMARSVAKSLMECQQLNIKDMAQRFTTEYFREPDRGYGGSVATVFEALRDEDFVAPHGPASRQFDGSGSYGNGGGMRIAPAALYGYDMSAHSLDSLVTDITKITHSHPDAINGAILVSAAVHSALHLDPSANGDFPAEQWLGALRRRLKLHEGDSSVYTDKLDQILTYVTADREPSPEDVQQHIGTGIAASEACPAAVYAFTQSTRTHCSIPRDSPFERALLLAISLGGDTDTVATMACAVAGAYYGVDAIPDSWQRACEGVGDAKESATALHTMVVQRSQGEECTQGDQFSQGNQFSQEDQCTQGDQFKQGDKFSQGDQSSQGDESMHGDKQ